MCRCFLIFLFSSLCHSVDGVCEMRNKWMREISDMDTRCALSITRQIANKSNVNEKCTRTRCLPWTYWIKGYTRLHIEQYDYFSPAAICIYTYYICAVVFLLSFLLSSVCFLNPYVLVRSFSFPLSLACSLARSLAPSPIPFNPPSMSVLRSLASLCVYMCVCVWMRIQSSISFRHFITHWISSLYLYYICVYNVYMFR